MRGFAGEFLSGGGGVVAGWGCGRTIRDRTGAQIRQILGVLLHGVWDLAQWEGVVADVRLRADARG